MEQARREPGYRPVSERLGDFKAVELRAGEDEIVAQAARCMDCGTPFCHGCGCPLNNLIPEFNEQVYRRRWREALDLLLTVNPFPEFTARVCPALCEGSCVLGIHEEPVTIRQIELAIIEKGFEEGWIRPGTPAVRRVGRVAVIGSGPAGLAVADTVSRAGYGVVVYESAARPGGILRYGIPEFKLEKWMVDRRIDLLKAQGVVFETGVAIGRDLSARYLKDRFEAVCLCAGARVPRDLAIPGRELGGIHFAMEYLVLQNRVLGGEPVPPGELISAEDKNVVIIGGGDTGSDCLGTALRQGARAVVQIEILPEPPPTRADSTPWPMWPHQLRVSSSHKEGGTRYWGMTALRFVGDGARVTGIEVCTVDWAPGANGRSAPRPRTGSERRFSADLVLLAMGFTGPAANPFADEWGLKLNERGVMARDADGQTSADGIFAAGDMTQGASLVVRAIADGRRVGARMVAYLAR
jgi:glutamate synthase (NADPH/NADH) small chain